MSVAFGITPNPPDLAPPQTYGRPTTPEISLIVPSSRTPNKSC